MLCAAILLCLTAGRAAGQGGLELKEGDRVRLTSPTGERTGIALVTETRPWEFAFRLEHDPSGRIWTRQLVTIDTLWVSHGRSRWGAARAGGVWGAYLGAGAGALAGILSAPERGRLSVGGSAAAFGAGGAVAGALTGALLGAVLAREHWTTYLLGAGRR